MPAQDGRPPRASAFPKVALTAVPVWPQICPLLKVGRRCREATPVATAPVPSEPSAGPSLPLGTIFMVKEYER
jgi:hypothetical protein